MTTVTPPVTFAFAFDIPFQPTYYDRRAPIVWVGFQSA